MDQLVREFLGEAEELIDMLGVDLQTLRARRAEGRTRRELVARVFRHVHTLKGSSAALELSAITSIMHEFESLLDSVRKGRTTLDESILDTFDETITVISQVLRAIAGGEQHPVPPSLVERLRGLAQTNESKDVRSDAMSRVISALPDDIAGVLSVHEEHRLREAMSEGATVFVVETNFDMATFDTEFKELSDALSECGEIVSTQPGIATAANDKINFRIVYVTENTASQLSARLAHIGPIDLRELDSGTVKETGAAVHDASQAKVTETSAQLSIAPLTSLVRIDLTELDALITTTHELFTDTMDTFDLALPAKGEDTELKTRVEEIRRKFEELEKSLLGMHMVPLRQTFDRAIRAGAVAAREAGKDIDFESEGGEAQLDKALSDLIADPLLHILRNAVDHGIESRDERMSIGKNVRGSIKLEASIEADQVSIRITDDGRGIDPLRVARAAFDRGVIEGQTEISDEESLRLIFTPGFSTAEKVSEVSGRGVGLDIVERAVAKVGGKILVHSKVGVGTTFELLMPNAKAFAPPHAIRFGRQIT